MSEQNNDKREKREDEMYCASCGAIVKKEAEICVKCGVRVKGLPPRANYVIPQLKSPGASLLLSFFIPGLGQIYNEEYKKGAVFMITAVLLWKLAEAVSGIGGVLFFVFWGCNLYDANVTAKKINERGFIK